MMRYGQEPRTLTRGDVSGSRYYDQDIQVLAMQLARREKSLVDKTMLLAGRENSLVEKTRQFEATVRETSNRLQQFQLALSQKEEALRQTHLDLERRAIEVRRGEEAIAHGDLYSTEYQAVRPDLDVTLGPLLKEGTEAIYREDGQDSVARTRGLEGLAQMLRKLSKSFGEEDTQLLNALFMIHHPARCDSCYTPITKSYQKHIKKLRNDRGERIAAEKTPGLVMQPTRSLKRRCSWST